MKNPGPGTGAGTHQKIRERNRDYFFIRDRDFKKSRLCLEFNNTFQKIRDSGPGPGLKIEKSRIGDRDSDSRDEGCRDSTLRDSVPGTENFPGRGSGPLPTPGDKPLFENLEG